MSKTSKHFYLEEDTLLSLKFIQKKEHTSSSDIVNKAIKAYYDNLDKEEDAMTYVVKSIKELSDNITSSQNLSKKNTDELRKYLEAMWLGLRITDIPNDEDTNLYLQKFKSELKENKFND